MTHPVSVVPAANCACVFVSSASSKLHEIAVDATETDADAESVHSGYETEETEQCEAGIGEVE